MVSLLSMICMGISALLSAGVPILLFLVPRKRLGLRFLPLAAGAAAFVLFALILEPVLHRLLLTPGSPILTNPFFYMLYGGLAAGVFEETARLLVFLLFRRSFRGVFLPLSYGIGHGGIEALLLSAFPMVNNIALGWMINFGAIEGVLSMLSGSVLAQVEAQTAALTGTPPLVFLLSGAERMFALVIQISLSVIVWHSVAEKGWFFWLFPLAILLHALADFPAALYQTGVLRSIVAVESLLLLSAASILLIARMIHKKTTTAVEDCG